MDPVKVIVATDDDGSEALYMNGDFVFSEGSTVYACDIAEAVGDKTIQFSHVSLGFVVGDWPQKFAELNVPE